MQVWTGLTAIFAVPPNKIAKFSLLNLFPFLLLKLCTSCDNDLWAKSKPADIAPCTQNNKKLIIVLFVNSTHYTGTVWIIAGRRGRRQVRRVKSRTHNNACYSNDYARSQVTRASFRRPRAASTCLVEQFAVREKQKSGQPCNGSFWNDTFFVNSNDSTLSKSFFPEISSMGFSISLLIPQNKLLFPIQ